MAGGIFSLAKLFGITIRESANDGSDFTNPDADYRRLFLGEDGVLHLKDSAGVVTTPSLASSLTRVETDQSLTGNNSFVDLATTGPAVTITVNTKVLVTVGAETYFSASSAYGAMGYAVSGANTIAAARAKSFLASSGGGGGAGAITGASRSFMLTGLTPGSTTFTAKYNQLGGAGQTNWQSRELSVVCLD